MPTFTRSAYDEVVSRARRGGDAEVCGVLGGQSVRRRNDANLSRTPTDADEVRPAIERVVTTVYPVENVADSPRYRYELEPEGQLAAIQTLEDRGETLVGFYHSHPRGPSSPSETDVETATWPDASYVIVALDGEPYVGSWRWDGETFEQELVRLVADHRIPRESHGSGNGNGNGNTAGNADGTIQKSR